MLGMLPLISGCNLKDEVAGWRTNDPIDRPQNLTRDDYRNMNRTENYCQKRVRHLVRLVYRRFLMWLRLLLLRAHLKWVIRSRFHCRDR